MRYQGLTIKQYEKIYQISRKKNIKIDDIVDEIIDLVNYQFCDSVDEAIDAFDFSAVLIRN